MLRKHVSETSFVLPGGNLNLFRERFELTECNNYFLDSLPNKFGARDLSVVRNSEVVRYSGAVNVLRQRE